MKQETYDVSGQPVLVPRRVPTVDIVASVESALKRCDVQAAELARGKISNIIRRYRKEQRRGQSNLTPDEIAAMRAIARDDNILSLYRRIRVTQQLS